MRNGEILFTREGTGNLSFSFEAECRTRGSKTNTGKVRDTQACGVGIVACVRMRTLLNGNCEAVSKCSMMPKGEAYVFWNENGREPDSCPGSPTFDVLHPPCS